MGKLAERLADPARSGVYRIETCEALEEAAALNGFRLRKISFGAGAPALPALDAQVVVVSGFERLACQRPTEMESLLARLRAAAESERARNRCFFAAFLDPQALVTALQPLYRWRKS